MKTLVLVVALPLCAFGVEVYVDNRSGSDANDGLSKERAFATLKKATSVLSAGDILNVAAGCRFREPLIIRKGGTVSRPIVIRGGGSVVSGLAPIPSDGWTSKGEGLYLSANKICSGALRPRVFLGEGRMISVICDHYNDVKPEALAPMTAIWNEEGIWFRAESEKKPSDYDLRGSFGNGAHSGVLIENCDFVIVEDIATEYFPNDGFNVHGSCHGLIFRNIVARWNGDDGFSVHEDVQANVYGACLHHNDFGIQDVQASQTLYFGCTVVSNRLCGIDVYGGMRVFHNVEVGGNAGGQMRFSRWPAGGLGLQKENPMFDCEAYLKNVHIEGGRGFGMEVNLGASVTAVGCAVSDVETGLSLKGKLHMLSSSVTDCRKQTVVRRSKDIEFVVQDCRIDPRPH